MVRYLFEEVFDMRSSMHIESVNGSITEWSRAEGKVQNRSKASESNILSFGWCAYAYIRELICKGAAKT